MNLHTEKKLLTYLDILTNGWVGVQASLEARCVEFYIFSVDNTHESMHEFIWKTDNWHKMCYWLELEN